MAQTLFDKYGGFDTFSSVVSNFYQKILDSSQLSHYFDGIKMERLMSHQTSFISKALGGPDKYEGRDLVAAHKGFNISDPDFLEMAELLEEALEEAGVEAADVASIIAVITSLKDQVVGR